MHVIASELSSVLAYDYVSLFLNDERRDGTNCYELTQEGQSIRPSPESMPEHSLASWVFEHQQAALIPGGEIQLWLGTRVAARKSVSGYPDVTIALAIPMATLELPR